MRSATTRYDMLQEQHASVIRQIDRIRTGSEPTRVDLENWGNLITKRDRIQGQLNHLAGQM
jgi:hypothetical protein